MVSDYSGAAVRRLRGSAPSFLQSFPLTPVSECSDSPLPATRDTTFGLDEVCGSPAIDGRVI
jgi:hypothetical protein